MDSPAAHALNKPAAAIGLVVVAMLAFEVGWGANVGSALLFLAYELVYVVGPGVLLYLVLASRPGRPIRQLALGWALGSAIEVFAFMITAALGARDLFTVYPLLVAMPALIVLTRRRDPIEPGGSAAEDEGERISTRFYWTLAGFCVLAMGLLSLAYFPGVPAPGSRTFSYFPDGSWHLALAAEAKHHWPIMDPNVSGQPLPYHDFVHFHMAAASQVTGIGLPEVFFRLFNLPLALAVILLYVTAGVTFARSARIGLLAVALLLFVGELQLEFVRSFNLPFLGVFIEFLDLSPSFFYGLVLLIALVIAVGERVTSGERGGFGDWVLIAVLMMGATNAKVVVLPIILAALALFGLWRLVDTRRVEWTTVAIGAIALVAMGATYLSQYAGHSSGLELASFQTFNSMPVVALIKSYLSGLVDFPLDTALLAVGGVVLGLVGLLGAQLAGIWAGGVVGDARRQPQLAWLLAIFAVALLGLAAAFGPGNGNQLYLIQAAIAVGWLPTAIGLQTLWIRRPAMRGLPRSAVRLIVIGLVLLVALIVAPSALNLFSGADAPAQTYLFLYGGFAVLLALAIVAARRYLEPGRWWARTLVCGAFMLVGFAGIIADYVIDRIDSPKTTPSGVFSKLTPELYDGLSWMRNNTSTDSVFAVNNSGTFDFDYSAFSERRAFIEGVAYTRKVLDAGYGAEMATNFADAFPDRAALNKAAFAGNPDAVQTLIDDYGVRYLVVDSAGDVPVNRVKLSGLAEPVFDDSDVTVLKLIGAGAT